MFTLNLDAEILHTDAQIMHESCLVNKGVRNGRILGLKPPLNLIVSKTVLPAQRILIIFAYILLVKFRLNANTTE